MTAINATTINNPFASAKGLNMDVSEVESDFLHGLRTGCLPAPPVDSADYAECHLQDLLRDGMTDEEARKQLASESAQYHVAMGELLDRARRLLAQAEAQMPCKTA